MTKLLVSAIAAAGMLVAPATAATYVFKGEIENPGVNVVADNGVNCASSSPLQDLCSPAVGVGLEYDDFGFDLTVDGFQDVVHDGTSVTSRVDAIVIQDRTPRDSGLGVFSDGDGNSDDQVQAKTGESIKFTFEGDNAFLLSNIEFNRGGDVDCSAPSNSGPSEGECGLIDIFVDNVFYKTLDSADLDVIAGEGDFLDVITKAGKMFEFVANRASNDPSGFTIAQFTVQEVPIPGALPLLLSGIAGLGFAARRKKTA